MLLTAAITIGLIAEDFSGNIITIKCITMARMSSKRKTAKNAEIQIVNKLLVVIIYISSMIVYTVKCDESLCVVNSGLFDFQ